MKETLKKLISCNKKLINTMEKIHNYNKKILNKKKIYTGAVEKYKN